MQIYSITNLFRNVANIQQYTHMYRVCLKNKYYVTDTRYNLVSSRKIKSYAYMRR